ncbi:MAG: SPFH domain-containing protein [Bacilli bacterium]|nr:SPFH domain-containing protein [Bacilli bacterium]
MANVIDVINYEGGNDVLIYKYPKQDFNLGSQLIVHESQEAVFFKDGKALESFGAGRHTLTTQNIAGLKNIINSMAGGENVFHSEIYFINLVTMLGIKWGTDSRIRMYDPISGLHLEIGASGSFNLKVIDGRKLLIKVVGTASSFVQENIFGSVGYTQLNTASKFKALVISKVKANLAKAIRENDFDILEIDEHIDELSEVLRVEVNKVLDEYGLYMPEFFITTIATPDDDPNFKRLKLQHAERYLLVQEQRIKEAEAVAAKKRAEAEAELKVAIARGDALAEAEARKILAEASATEIKAKGFAEAEVLQAKGAMYQAETARIVGQAAAENESSGSAGNIASDVVKAGIGLGVGVAVAKNVAGTVNNVIDNDNTWVCPVCGHKGNKSNFCEDCGSKKPSAESGWTCPECGKSGIMSKFCPDCGHKRGE